MRPRLIACVLVSIAVHSGSSMAARWESGADSKARPELVHLDERQLFEEAFAVCARRAVLLGAARDAAGEAVIAAAEDYLAVIESVAREKWGTVPAWLRELSFARSTRACQLVFRNFVSGEIPPETKPARAVPSERLGAASTPTSGVHVPPAGVGKPPRLPRAARTVPVGTRTPLIRLPAFPLVWPTPAAPQVALPTPPTPGLAVQKRAKPPSPVLTTPRRSAAATAPRVPPTPFQREEITEDLPPWFR